MYHIQLVDPIDRDKLAAFLKEKDIYTTFRYYPIHKVNFYKKYSNNNLVNTNRITENTLCIPLHQSLKRSEIKYIVKTIKDYGKAK